ncbi:MAG: metal-dependent transcriptional regulator [Endomicrobiales bacterium]|nr:metal-dependent transcriptional regulator [Endomicrobiales bacterium]
MKSKKWHDIEEALGVVWNFLDRKQKDGGKLHEILSHGISDRVTEDLAVHGLIHVEGDDIKLTKEGEELGRDVTRRHRLAERLLADVIEVKGEDVDKTACEIEHIISSDVADSICTLLGHPKACPHGSRIPEGKCCREAEARIESIVVPLTKMSVGDRTAVSYIITADHPHLHKLLSLGLVPGTDITLHQKSPSYIIKAGETQIALDSEVAGHIYVRKR